MKMTSNSTFSKNAGAANELPTATMLVADHYQLDRRVLHEAQTLSNQGFSTRIVSLVHGMVSPRGLPFNTVLCGPDGQHPLGNPSRGRIDRLKKVLVLFASMVPKQLIEIAFCRWFDPAHRHARVVHTLPRVDSDIIIAHDLPQLSLALKLRQQQGFGKVIFDAHELYDEQLDQCTTQTFRRYWRAIADRYVDGCDGVMTVARRIAEELARRHKMLEVPTVLRNACPYVATWSDRHSLHRLYGIPEERRIVLCQGGIIPGRSLEEFIAAWRYLHRPRPALVFLGFGPPSYKRHLKNLIRKFGVGEDVYLGKAVLPDEVLQYTHSAALGLISNRGQGINNTDGGPNRLFEYIQARVPILSYEHRGVREILRQTETGWVVRWESPSQLAAIISRKLDEAEAMSQERLDHAARMFCWENEEPKFVELINRLSEAVQRCGIG